MGLLPGIATIGYSLLCAVAIVCALSIDEILTIGSYISIHRDMDNS